MNFNYNTILKFLKRFFIKKELVFTNDNSERNIKLNYDARANFKEFVDLIDDRTLFFLDQYR